MNTPYESIYGRFMPKITDYNFGNYEQSDLELILEALMLSAIPKFRIFKKILVDRDSTLKVFNQNLGDEAEEIVASLMVIEWLKPQTYNLELLKQSMGNKDFQITSQANHLKSLTELYKITKKEINQSMGLLSYEIGLENGLY